MNGLVEKFRLGSHWAETGSGKQPSGSITENGPPAVENRIGEQTSGRSKKTDWPPSEGSRGTSVPMWNSDIGREETEPSGNVKSEPPWEPTTSVEGEQTR